LGPFYTNSTKSYTLSTPPRPADISINGQVLQQATEYEALLKKQGRDAKYEVESFDAQVINLRFALAVPSDLQTNDLNRMSVLVQVTGRVTVGGGSKAKEGSADATTSTAASGSGSAGTTGPTGARAFNEVFVLVPNWDALAKNAPRGLRRMVILSQNFRAL
jgi:NTF2-related export protein 1/2